MKLYFIAFLSLLITESFVKSDDENPEDIDDVKPPVIEENKEASLSKNLETTLPLIHSESSLKSKNNSSTANFTAKQVVGGQKEIVKTDAEKKEELLTGKDESSLTNSKLLNELTTAASETTAPSIAFNQQVEENAEDSKSNVGEKADKENAAPEFEAKQDVEGGKGEEDPDANVDKPAQEDPPKDEADGAAKEDRETPEVGAEGLHEAVEEAKGNPAPVVAAAASENKKDSTDEEQTLDAEPVIRPHRTDLTRQLQSEYDRNNNEDEESTGFMSFFFIATFLVVFIYVLQHNKKKILGLMFEGRNGKNSSRRGGNIKYRRLSQNDG